MASGVPVERGVTVRSVRSDTDGALSELRHADGRTELARSRFVVGCDGADSTVRRQAGIAFPASPYRPRLLLADVELSGELDPDALHGIMAPAGALFLFPFPGGRACGCSRCSRGGTPLATRPRWWRRRSRGHRVARWPCGGCAGPSACS